MNNQIQYLYHILEQWVENGVSYLPRFFLGILTFFTFYWFSKAIKKIIGVFYKKTFYKKIPLVNFISIIAYSGILLLGIFLTLEILGLENALTKLIASAGIIGLIAGLAFQDIASNAFTGFLVKIQRPFKEGDWINLEDNYGKVIDISWLTTSIQTIEGQEIFIPNNLIYSSSFTNYSTFAKRLIVLKAGVSYGDDLVLVRKVALEEVIKIDKLLNTEPIDFYFTDIGGSNYNFTLRFWIQFSHHNDYLQAMSQIIMRIKKRFEQENILIAYNVTTLDFGVKGGLSIFEKAFSVTNHTELNNKNISQSENQ